MAMLVPKGIRKRLIVMDVGERSEEPFKDLFNEVRSFPTVKINPDTDVVMFQGGTDVNPALYHQKKHPFTQPSDIRRDLKEQMVAIACIKAKIPMLGICRGSQFLTVMSGGSLVQHTSHHGTSHEVSTGLMLDNQVIRVSSTHHQMMLPNPAIPHTMLAWSTGISNFYQGEDACNIFERMPLQKFGQETIVIEPEIVHYYKTKSLCIQGHPEYFPKDQKYDAFRRNCQKLVELFLINSK